MAPDEVDLDRGPAPVVTGRQAHGMEAHWRRVNPASDSPMARQASTTARASASRQYRRPTTAAMSVSLAIAPPLSPILRRREHRARWCPAKTWEGRTLTFRAPDMGAEIYATPGPVYARVRSVPGY